MCITDEMQQVFLMNVRIHVVVADEVTTVVN